MTRTQRRPRLDCRIPCEVIGENQQRVVATVVSLSEGGLSLQAPLRVEQGDPIRLRILPQRRKRAVNVEAIVWNDRPARGGGRRSRLRVLGCVVSTPSPRFLDLLAEIEKRKAAVAPPTPPEQLLGEEPSSQVEVDLPRSREPLPPPKPEPEEALPRFRVRFKQVGGPRTRSLTVRAHSMVDAEKRARAEIECTIAGAGAWDLLEVIRKS